MRRKNFVAIFLLVFTMMLSSFAFYTYQVIYTPNVLIGEEDRYFAIEKGTTFKQLQNKLDEERIVFDLVSFSLLAKIKDLDTQIKPGMYLLKEEMSNLQLVNLLRSGRQTPVKLTFTNARKLEELSKKLSSSFAFDSTEMATVLLNDTTAAHFGFTSDTFIGMFIPNTYEVYWTDTPLKLLERLKKEYDNFWDANRREKAKNVGLSVQEVSTLASIVGSETNMREEMPTIAGVYLNRLKRSIPLQADPTLVFALGDFSIRRILNRDKLLESPYNTYKYKGLPPGPIRMPSITAIDAVLNADQHNYLYFCAKPDFSGYHVFASTLADHNRNARAFQRALNAERIYR
ncbi:MAG: endolytic transglycosylase MltG [Bacteroidota bacterium]